MKISNIPNFRRPRQHGQCPACDHHGTDCHCHRQPKKAAAIFARRQIETAVKAMSAANKLVKYYHLKDEVTVPNLLPTEADDTYVDANDRFVVSLVVGFGMADGVSTPQEAVGAALEFVTSDEGSPNTHWQCLDRKTSVLHMIEQRDAHE